jgi:hypothetical protein
MTGMPSRFSSPVNSILPCSVERKRFFVARSRDGLYLHAPAALREGYKMVVEAPRQTLPPVSCPDTYQVHIGGRLRLREEAEEISRHTVSIFDDIGRVAELVHEHGMVDAQGAVAFPEVLNLGNDLIAVSLGTVPDLHKKLRSLWISALRVRRADGVTPQNRQLHALVIIRLFGIALSILLL